MVISKSIVVLAMALMAFVLGSIFTFGIWETESFAVRYSVLLLSSGFFYMLLIWSMRKMGILKVEGFDD